jgi:4-amino-4-deoxychorismate lyase
MNIVIANYLSESQFSIRALDAKQDLLAAQLDIGKFCVAADQALFTKVCLQDRAFNYGDGCFTTIYGESTQVFLLNEHLQRLARDCHKLSIGLCLNTLQAWLLLALKCMITKSHAAYAVKILVSRGVGGRGYELPTQLNTSVVVSISPCQVSKPPGIQRGYEYTIKQANMTLSSQTLLAGIKHNNRLEQVLAKRELQQYDCNDLVLCDNTGILIEATAANIFYQKDGVWFTPQIMHCGVSGVMRDTVIAFFQSVGVRCEINASPFSELLNADAVFLCNAIKFIIPVSAIVLNDKEHPFTLWEVSALAFDLREWIGKHHKVEF